MMRSRRLSHAAAFSLLGLLAGLVAACGGADTDTSGETSTEPCKAAGAATLDPIECHLGVCNALIPACVAGMPASCPAAEPASAEACGDGLDNDCNGSIDEGCPCADGATEPCYSGSPETRGKGACHDGVQTCQGGAWQGCKGDVRPTKDVCDTVDNDCDGEVDQGCTCEEGVKIACYSGPGGTVDVGPCKAGALTCAGGKWGECEGAVTPQPEACDAVDNDCNGQVDDAELGQGAPCDLGAFGPCKAGVTGCGAAGLQCMQAVFPVEETCDGVDNNCDGVIDNGSFCCADGKKGGPESDVDCGAACDVKCDAGKACHSGEDCKSGVCSSAICG